MCITVVPIDVNEALIEEQERKWEIIAHADPTYHLENSYYLDGSAYYSVCFDNYSYETHEFNGYATVTIGANVTTIGKSVFEGCTKLSSVTIGSKVTKIGDKAFKKCTSLTKITIPSKVKIKK